jgi:hypothetical protein
VEKTQLLWEQRLKNKLGDLNDHIFAQLERLSDENLTPDLIDTEVKRSNAITGLAEQILKQAALKVQAAKIMSDHGLDPTPHFPQIESPHVPGLRAVNESKP